MTLTKAAQNAKTADRDAAIAELRSILPTLTTDSEGRPVIYTILRHVSASGMTRHIDVFGITTNGDPHWLTRRVADVLDYRQDTAGALKVGGAGMDMGFHVVYSLARSISEDHGPDSGYSLSQRWL